MKSQMHAVCCSLLGLLTGVPAFAAGKHQLSAENQGVIFRSQLSNDSVQVFSVLGAAASYAYRMGFRWSIFTRYQAVTSGHTVFLNGASVGLDYAVFGGQTRTSQVAGNSIVEFEFPYRLGVSLAAAERSYNLTELKNGTSVSFEDMVPTKGSFTGVEAGVSLEIPLGDSLSVLGRATYLLPSFPAEATQTGSLSSFSVGIGALL